MNEQVLTEQSVLLIRIMLSETGFVKNLIDKKELSYYSKITINPESKSIVLGKTKVGWWNRLIGDEKEIPFDSFVNQVRTFLSVRGEKEGYGEKIRIELLKDLDDMSVAGRFNDIVDRLFMVGYLCVKTAWSSFSLEALGMSNNCDQEHNINVIGQTFTKTFRAKNGDFNIDVEFGPTGAFIR